MDFNPKASLKLARVRRYGSHRVKVRLKNRVRSGFTEGLVLGLLKFDRDLRMVRGRRTRGRSTQAHSNLFMSFCWPTPTEWPPQDFYNTRLGVPAQIWEE